MLRYIRSALIRNLIGTAALAGLLACGSSSSIQPPEVQQLNPPTIGSRTPDFLLYVVGTGFTPDGRIFLGGVELVQLSRSSTYLLARVPGGTAGTTMPGAIAVSVENADGTRSNEALLEVSEAAAPVLQEISSDLCSGHALLNVTLIGDNFTVDTSLEVDGQPAAILSRTRSTLSFATPLKYGRYSFTVNVPAPGGGQATIGYPTFLGCD